MKKLNVNSDICIGCGACVAIDPEHFDFNDDGLSEVISNENIDGENTVNAIESCPVSAISIENGGCSEDCHCGCDDCTHDEECHCNCCHE